MYIVQNSVPPTQLNCQAMHPSGDSLKRHGLIKSCWNSEMHPKQKYFLLFLNLRSAIVYSVFRIQSTFKKSKSKGNAELQYLFSRK